MSNQSPHGGKWWFVTWTTFGTWLPGDPRGFQTWRGREYIPPPERYAEPEEPTYDASAYASRHQSAKDQLTQQPVFLSVEQRRTAVDAIVEEVDEMRILQPSILSVAAAHSHILSKFATSIKQAVGRLKFAATRRLHECGFEAERVWVRECHMKSKPTLKEAVQAFRYIARHVDEGAIVHVWRELTFDSQY